MVYLAADNNLEPFAIQDFNEMEQIGSSNDVNIVVQMDRSPGYDGSNGNWSDTRRYRVLQDNNPSTITSPVIQNIGEANMGDPQVLVDFVNWAKQNYPAQRYCLVLWDHGGGWRNRPAANAGLQVLHSPVPPGLGELGTIIHTRAAASASKPEFHNPFDGGWGRYKDVCVDDTDNDRLLSDEIASALQATGTVFDIVGYDACLMAMLENAYEIRNFASYMVGSEELEPGDGWPYHLLLAPLVANPDMSAADLSRTITQQYAASYAAGDGSDQTFSALDLSKLNGVITGVNALASAIVNDNTAWTQVTNAFAATDSYNQRQHRDLYDFADKLSLLVGGAIQNAANNLKTAISSMVIENYTEGDHPNARGLAIYFPAQDAFDPRYSSPTQKLDFPADTQWDEFLNSFYQGGNPQTSFDPYEPNNNYAQAFGPVKSGETYQGYLNAPNDVDIYKIVTGSSFDVSIDLLVPADFDMFITRVSNGQVDTLAGSVEFGTTPEHLEGTEVAAGTYYILVVPYETAGDPYALQVNIAGGEGNVDLTLSYDDGEPEYGIVSTRQDLNEGVSCYFNPPDAPAKLKGIWYFIYDLDVVPGNGDDGSFYVFGADYYGALLPEELRPITPGGAGWNFVDLSADNITLYGDFFAGMFWDGFNTPAVGWDTTASNGINLIYTEIDGVEDFYQGSGTFFIRAEVSYTNLTTGVEETVLLAPRVYALAQNYPNPFNPETSIRYNLPVAGDVALKVFDVSGREVTVIESGLKSAGEHLAVWNGRDATGTPAASGVYFYRLEAKSPTGNKTLLTKKMTLVK